MVPQLYTKTPASRTTNVVFYQEKQKLISLREDTALNQKKIEGFNPVGNYSYQFFICCPRDCVSRHNGGTSGAPLKPLRVDSALKALLSLRGLRRAPAVPSLCRQTQFLVQQMLNATVGINGLTPMCYIF